MSYFCSLVEAMGEDVKLFPNLREITLDDVFCDSSLIDEHGNMGCGRILSRHVDNLEELTVLRGEHLQEILDNDVLIVLAFHPIYSPT